MMVEISAKIFLGIIGTSMGLFETGFRIFISAMIISESAVDLGHLISQTKVYGVSPLPPKKFPKSVSETELQISYVLRQ